MLLQRGCAGCEQSAMIFLPVPLQALAWQAELRRSCSSINYYWRLVMTAVSFTLFSLGGLLLSLIGFNPVITSRQ
jgi:hypothetical protein